MKPASIERCLNGLLAGLLLCGSIAAAAQERKACSARQRPEISALDRVHRLEEFRIFYALEGADALQHTQDLDGNGTPDVVEDAARQLVAARRLYTEVIGLVHPLEQPRYRQRTRGIDVNLRRLKTGSTGLAYDEVSNYLRPIDGPSGRCALRIDLDTRWRAASQTPAHELFHLFQNGYTMFKVRWFTEGVARWAESALERNAERAGTLPTTPDARDALFASSYRASGFWNRLAQLQDPQGFFQAPASLRAMRYVDGRRILEDERLHGRVFMKAVLEAMGRVAEDVSRRNGWPPFGWKEADQKSRANDADAWAAVRAAVKDTRVDSPEVQKMLALPGPRAVEVAGIAAR